MKRVWILLSAIVVMASCNEKSISPSNSEKMNNQEKQKLEKLLGEYQKSLNTSDAKLAQSLYTKDGIFMPTEAPSGIGSQGILDAYNYVFSLIKLNIEFHIDEIAVEGNMAYAVTSSKGTTTILSNGATMPESNRELFVFEKNEGEWKIARYMFNKTSPAAKN